MGLPEFSSTDVKRLGELGMLNEQIIQLRYALPFVGAFANKKNFAALADICSLLDDVNNLSSDLIRKLEALAMQISAAHSVAHGLIEQKYWQGDRVDDYGLTSSHHLIPRLSALGSAAKNAKDELPKIPTRAKTACPEPIARIDAALRTGWRTVHLSAVRGLTGKESVAEIFKDAKARNVPPPYPKAFLPSKAAASPFREIAGICYRTVGGTSDPVRAIENFLASERALKKKLTTAFNAGIAKANRKPGRRKQSATERT